MLLRLASARLVTPTSVGGPGDKCSSFGCLVPRAHASQSRNIAASTYSSAKIFRATTAEKSTFEDIYVTQKLNSVEMPQKLPDMTNLTVTAGAL